MPHLVHRLISLPVRLAALSLFVSGCTQIALPFGGHDFATAQITVSSSTAPADGVTPVTVTLTLTDSDGQTVTGWSAVFSSDNAGAQFTQPPGVSGNDGVLTATLTSTVAKRTTITAVVTQNDLTATLSNTAQVTFGAAAVVASLQMTGIPTTVPAGQVYDTTITARDAQGAVVDDYVGTLHFTSDDANAALPFDTTFSLADKGSKHVSLALKTAGTHVLMATDTKVPSLTAVQRNILVLPGAATVFAITSPSPTYHAGASVELDVSVTDSFGNTVTSYAGVAHFSSTDSGASLPADFTFGSSNVGNANFTHVILTKSGSVQVSVTDTVNHLAGSILLTGSPGLAASFTVAAPGIVQAGNIARAGVVQSLTVTALDAYGNVATGFANTVHFTSSDPLALLPADYQFNAGSGTVAFTNSTVFKTAGVQSVTVVQVASPNVNGGLGGITVTPGTASALSFGGLAAGAIAGTALPVGVIALDVYGNVATSYLGAVKVTSSDAGAQGVPATHTFSASDAGTWSTLSISFAAAGTQTLNAADQSSGGIMANANVLVSAGALHALSLSPLPPRATLKQNLSLGVSAVDANNNVIPGYTGAVTFSSTDPIANLPATYTFTSADAGSHTFTLSFKTGTAAGQNQTVTVQDTVASLSVTSSVVSVITGGIANFTVAGFPSPTNAGAQGQFSVTALDSNNATLTNYTGAVTFTSSDHNATFVPPSYTFVLGDAGVHTFAATLQTVGTQSITVTDPIYSATGTQSGITVNPLPASALAVYNITTAQAGVPATFSVKAVDTYGNLAVSYTGTVTFASSDAQAVLPGNYTFVAGDNSAHTFTGAATFKTANTNQTLRATDVATASITGVTTVKVSPGPTTRYTLSTLPSPVVAGTRLSPVVSVFDDLGNPNTNYTGVVHFVSSDTNAVLPANYQFQAADNGVKTFTNGLALVTASPNTTVTINDTLNGGASASQGNIVVNPAPFSTFAVTGIPTPNIIAGTVSSLTVRATDAYFNSITSYTGTVTFASSDAKASLPASYSFVSSELGAHTFNSAVTLKTAGNQNVTVTDTKTAAYTGAQNTNVIAASAQSLVVSGIPNPNGGTPAGTATSPVVQVFDSYGNTATGYSGTVAFSGTDGQATYPAVHPFVARDAGIYTFVAGLVLKTAGNQNVTATDTVNAALTGSQNGIVIVAGSAQSMKLTGPAAATLPTSLTAGTSESVVVGIYDAYNNLDSGYTGAVTFSSTDPSAALPALYTFSAAGDKGAHTFAGGVILKTVGNQNVTVTSTAAPIIKATQGPVTVGPASTSKLTLTGVPSQTSAGSAFPFTVHAFDAYANPTPSYAGTVSFSSNDANALLPANYTFVGTATYSSNATFEIPQTGATLNVADTSNSSIQGNVSGVVVIGVGVLATSSANPNHMCAITGVAAQASLKCWGLNNNGALGDYNTINYGSAAGQMGPNLPSVPFDGSLVPTQVAVGGDLTCTLLNDDSLRCFGDNSSGALGYGDTANRGGVNPNTLGSYLPGVNLGSHSVAQFAVGPHGACAIVEDGSVRCWGLNGNGQLGYGDLLNRGGLANQMGAGLPAVNLGTGRTAKQISMGAIHNCALLDDKGIKCWGGNANGQLGLGDTVQRPTANANEIPLGTGRTALSIAAGADHTCAVLDDHNVRCWGGNEFGQLGINNETQSPGNANDAFLSVKATAVSAGNGYTCALLNQNGNNVQCWGQNANGQLGVGDATLRGSCTPNFFGVCTPGAVMSSGAVATLGGARSAIAVSAGNGVTCVQLDNQQVKCWGNGANGELGYGDVTQRGSGASQMGNFLPNISLW